MSLIKEYPNEIKRGNDLKEIKGIGKGTITRIDEIIDSGTLKEIDTSINQNSDKQNAINETITGIGPSKNKRIGKKRFYFRKTINRI